MNYINLLNDDVIVEICNYLGLIDMYSLLKAYNNEEWDIIALRVINYKAKMKFLYKKC